MPGAGTELLFPDIITNSGVIGHEKQNLVHIGIET